MSKTGLVLLLTVAIFLPHATNTQPTPVNVLTDLLTGSMQQLNGIALLGSSQMAFSTLTKLINSILQAMSQMSVPYYQSQLNALSTQQQALLNRLLGLQEKIKLSQSTVQATLKTVGTSLKSHTILADNIVLSYENSINMGIAVAKDQLDALLNSIPAQSDAAQKAIDDQLSLSNDISIATNLVSAQLAEVDALKNAPLAEYGNVALPNPGSPDPILSHCIQVSVSFANTYTSQPNVALFSSSLGALGASDRALDVTLISVSNTGMIIDSCSRTPPTYTYVPTQVSYYVVSNS
jgi:hypothetical protein